MKRLKFLFLAALLAAAVPTYAAERACVILLHGLARSDASLLVMEEALEQAGYAVINRSYPSTETSIAALSERALPTARRSCAAQAPGGVIHVVTHSMGGILLRGWAQAHPAADWGRVVMLAPPNHGSELVDALGALQPFRWVNGPAGMELSTGPDGTPQRLGPVRFELGIIAGNRSLNAFHSSLLPGEDDGKVTVASTKVAGMRAHLTLPVTHTFMMNNPRVIAQTLMFLENGAFVPDLTLGEVLADVFLK
jgi:triacylglycerol lipase